MEEEIQKINSFNQTRALASGMLFNLCIGSYYVYGNINDYIMEYLKS